MKTQASLIPGLFWCTTHIVMTVVIGCTFVLGGCSSASNALITEEPVKYETLIIKSVSLQAADLDDDNRANLAAYNAVREQLIKAYSTSIEEYIKPRNLFKTVVISDNVDDPRKYEHPLVLETKFDKIMLGNRAKRIARYMFVGIPIFGRGIMMIEAKGRLLDGKSNKVLTTVKYDRNTSWDTSSLEDNLMKLTRNLAHDYAEFIESKITSDDPITSTDSDSWE